MDKTKINADELPGTALAYIGDSVFEVKVRERLLGTGIHDVGKLNKLALSYVKATKQSEALEKILPILTEEEAAIFRRGRNAHGVSLPKSASAGEYRRATGLEALFGWLYLKEKNERADELFEMCFEEKNESEVNG